MISILFARKKSVYNTLNVDKWDKTRDARKWPGGSVIIAHPPCRGWGDHKWKSKHDESELRLAIMAIHKIRLWGGILEHPRKSKLWKEMNLPLPGLKDKWGGYSICIKQSWFGHRAEKETLLYIVGIPEKELPPIPLSLDTITNTIENMGQPEREHTPIKLAIWLIQTATLIAKNLHHGQHSSNTWTLTQERS